MNIPLDYVYGISILPFAFFWVLFFALRKDLRSEMLSMSLIVGVLSPVTAALWWTHDWWYPITILGTPIGPEDFLLGFFSGGIMAVSYEFFFAKKHRADKTLRYFGGITEVLAVLAAITLFCLYVLGLNSFWASTVALLCALAGILLRRAEFLPNALFSGAFMLFASLFFYALLFILNDSWVQTVYIYPLSGIRVFGIPIEEFVFWFLAGAVFGPLYEYWKHESLRKTRKRT